MLAVRIKNNHAGYAGGLQSFEEMWLGPVGRQSPELVQQARAGAATSITRTNWIAKNVDAVRPRLVPCCKMLCVHTSGTQGSRLAAGGVNTINYREMWVIGR